MANGGIEMMLKKGFFLVESLVGVALFCLITHLLFSFISTARTIDFQVTMLNKKLADAEQVLMGLEFDSESKITKSMEPVDFEGIQLYLKTVIVDDGAKPVKLWTLCE